MKSQSYFRKKLSKPKDPIKDFVDDESFMRSECQKLIKELNQNLYYEHVIVIFKTKKIILRVKDQSVDLDTQSQRCPDLPTIFMQLYFYTACVRMDPTCSLIFMQDHRDDDTIAAQLQSTLTDMAVRMDPRILNWLDEQDGGFKESPAWSWIYDIVHVVGPLREYLDL